MSGHQSDHDLLIELNTKVSNLIEKVEAVTDKIEDMTERCMDHELALASVENKSEQVEGKVKEHEEKDEQEHKDARNRLTLIATTVSGFLSAIIAAIVSYTLRKV